MTLSSTQILGYQMRMLLKVLEFEKNWVHFKKIKNRSHILIRVQNNCSE